MSHRIKTDHPLHPFHRRRGVAASKSSTEITRQWGRADVVAGIADDGVEAGSYQTAVIRYTAGSMGVDEDGGIRLAFRFVSDMGRLQTQDPTADNYVSAVTSGSARIEVQVVAKGTVRPFQRTAFVTCRGASLHKGETIDVTLGDTTQGSRGWRQQTFCEAPFPVRVAVDLLGAHDYQELPYDLGWSIRPGPPARHVVHAPSFAAADETFVIRVKVEDAWGNPLRDLANDRPELVIDRDGASIPVRGQPAHDRGVWSYSASLRDPGVYLARVASDVPSTSHAVSVRNEAGMPELAYHWCDLHGQTGETVGVGTLDEYFRFGRHFGFLDGCAHQGNDFQIGEELWTHIKRAANDAYDPGRFVTFQGYEWSGTEAMGGDHNVYFHEDDPPIYRSSGWLDGNPFEEVAPLTSLYRALASHNALTVAHIGGRPASLTVSDPDAEPLMEIHSAWGTFEWVYQEAIERGYKIGFVCNSDGHKGRPGASYPGAGIFGTLGGLTCILSKTRDRDGFWEALWARRCYGTTGQRIVVEADLDGVPIGADVRTHHATVRARIVGTAPIERLELLSGTRTVDTVAPVSDSPQTVIVRFGGARTKGRARTVNWDVDVGIEGNAIVAAQMNGIFNPSNGISNRSDGGVSLRCTTTGNLVNLELRLQHGLQGRLAFSSETAESSVDIEDLDRHPRTLFSAPLDQRIEAFVVDRDRLPRVLEATFSTAIDHVAERPYFLRVTQIDEARAWTSPFYVRAPE